MSFEIHPLLEADCLSLVKVHFKAFDRAAGTHFFSREPSESSYEFMAKQRAKIIAKPKIAAYKAVDSSNGEMIGAAYFNIAPEGVSQETLDDPQPPMSEYAPEQNERLWRDFGKRMAECYAKHVGTRPAVEVLMLLVDPGWQGKGVGKALLDIGVREADRIGCLTYVEASDEGIRVYEKAGFEKIGTIDFDASTYSTATIKFPVDTIMMREASPSEPESKH